MRDPLRTKVLMASLFVLLFFGGSGCAVKVVRPEPLLLGGSNPGGAKVITYPIKVIVHDKDSFWDPHQIKDNIVGLAQLEGVRIVDIALDALTPGKERRPLENGIEWIKNQYARLPRCAPVNIIGGLFWALGLEKLAPGRGPGFLARLVYLTDWLQETLGEMNRVAGYLVPYKEMLVPKNWAAPPNRAVDRAQNGLLAAYVYVFQAIYWSLDEAIDAGQWVWKGAVWLVVAPWY